jgi:hypothetical protein
MGVLEYSLAAGFRATYRFSVRVHLVAKSHEKQDFQNLFRKLRTATGGGAMTFEDTLRALHRPDAPVFAVLDGAQFDDLPTALLLGGFVSRSLYLDRGDNDPQQVITAPHLVWLDGRAVKPVSPCRGSTISALLDLIDGQPRGVFWQCPAGGDALYKHLRGINMVLYPASALSTYERQSITATEVTALFRHADANVMMQIAYSLEPHNRGRLLGPCTGLACAPSQNWFSEPYFTLSRHPESTVVSGGLLKLSVAEARGIAKRHRDGLAGIVTDRLLAAGAIDELGAKLRAWVRASVERAAFYEIEALDDFETFAMLELKHGVSFEQDPRFALAKEELSYLMTPPAARLAYAKEACERVNDAT